VDSIQDASIVANKAVTQTLTSVSNNSSVAAHYTLTIGLDDMTGGAGADAFDGTFGVGVATTYTLGVTDILDGGTGIDTLNVTTGAEANSPTDALWANKINFEKIAFNSTGVGAQTVVTDANFATAFATGAVMSVETFAGAITIDMTGYTQTTTVNTTTIGTGAHTITTGTGAATVNATSLTDGAQTISGVNLNTVHATVFGAGAQTITSTSTSNVTVVADAHNGAQTITTGAGNDHVTTITAAGNANTITTNAGDDIIVTSAGNDLITGGAGRDIITGGDGVDTFAFGLADTGFTLETADVITDFSTQFDVITTEYTEGTVAIADGSSLTDFSAFTIAAATALSGATGAYIAYNAANSGDAWVLSDTNNNNVVDSGDTLIILTGINLSNEIAIGDIA
jgi:Ca2+-binding RTX toxin-like protein